MAENKKQTLDKHQNGNGFIANIMRCYYRITNALKIGYWFFINPKAIDINTIQLITDLYKLIMQVAVEQKPYMSNIGIIYPDGEKQEIVSLWDGASIGAKPNKRIEELLSENAELKRQLKKYVANENNAQRDIGQLAEK